MKEEGGHHIDEGFGRGELNRANDQLMLNNSAATLGDFGEEGTERGRRSNKEKHKREHGIELRNRLRDKLATAGKGRPGTNGGIIVGSRDRHNIVLLN